MIVTVITVGVVQVALYQVIDVIPMGHRLVAAVGPVLVRFIMSVALVVRCASFRVGRVHFKAMIVHVIAVCVMHVAIVQIVCVSVVLHRRMAAIMAMLVGVGT